MATKKPTPAAASVPGMMLVAREPIRLDGYDYVPGVALPEVDVASAQQLLDTQAAELAPAA